MATKIHRGFVGYTGLTLFVRVINSAGNMLDYADHTFKAAPANPLNPAKEVLVAKGFPANMAGLYERDETAVYADDIYNYDFVDGSLNIYADQGVMETISDVMTTTKQIKAQTDLIVSGGATSAGVALVGATVTLIKAKTDLIPSSPALENGGNLATLISRITGNVALAATALSTTTWTQTRATLLDKLSAIYAQAQLIVSGGATESNVSLRALASTALSTTTWTSTRAVEIDTLISRLTALRAGYLDNLSAGAVAQASILALAGVTITAIAAKTKNLPVDPASESSEEIIPEKIWKYSAALMTVSSSIGYLIKNDLNQLVATEGGNHFYITILDVSGNPIPAVSVIFWNSTYATIIEIAKTDSLGRAYFSAVDGTYQVFVTKFGSFSFSNPTQIVVASNVPTPASVIGTPITSSSSEVDSPW